MADEPPTSQSRQASPLLEFLPTLRQLSLLPSETAVRHVASEEERFERVREWNKCVRQVQPLSRDARIMEADGTKVSFDRAMGSIYIPQITVSDSDRLRRSARVARKLPTLQTPSGTYYLSSYTPTPEQKAQVIIDCEEVDGIYYISRQDWKRERRAQRIFTRDFPFHSSELDLYGIPEDKDGFRAFGIVQHYNLISEPLWQTLEFYQESY